MRPEDLALFKADPLYAIALGIAPPRCTVCDGDMAGDGWDGETPMRHLLSCACKWVKEGAIAPRLEDRGTET